jgi:hypothetical protein
MYHCWTRIPDALHRTSQDSGAIRKRLMRHGVRLGVEFVLQQRSKPYVSRHLFPEYINTIFVPYLNELQESEEFAHAKRCF